MHDEQLAELMAERDEQKAALKEARFLIAKLAGWQGMDLSELDEEYDGVITRMDNLLD